MKYASNSIKNNKASDDRDFETRRRCIAIEIMPTFQRIY